MNTRISPYTRPLNIALALVEEVGLQLALQQSSVSAGEAEFAHERSQKALINSLVDSFREDAIYLGDEISHGDDAVAYRRWIVHPLNRTSNCTISLTLQERAYNGEFVTVLAVIHAPTHEETYCAVRGEGSWCNGVPISFQNGNLENGIGAGDMDSPSLLSILVISSSQESEFVLPAARLIIQEAGFLGELRDESYSLSEEHTIAVTP